MRPVLRLVASLVTGIAVALVPVNVRALPTRVLPAVVVTIPDANLRACLNQVLGQPAGATLTDAQIGAIPSANCSFRNITDPTGWQYLVSASFISLQGNKLTGTLNVPAQLTKLQTLHVANDQLTALTLTSGLSQLDDVFATNNQLSTVTVAPNLSGLTHLNFANNRLANLGGLAFLPATTYVSAPTQTVTLPTAYRGVPYPVTMRDHRNQPVVITPQAGTTYTSGSLLYSATGTGTHSFESQAASLAWGQHSGTITQQVGASPATGALGDQSGDGVGDLFAVDATGQLRLYQGSTTASVVPAGVRGGGWNAMTYLSQIHDIDGDNRSDLLARRGSDQSLWVYRGLGGGHLTVWKQMGQNWGGMDQIVPVSNLGGGSAQYVVARRASDGALFRYTLTSNGLTNIKHVGQNWNGMKQILSVGDFTGDGRSDVLAIRCSDGTLWAYSGTSTAGIGSGRQVGHGWGTFIRAFSAGDLSGDARHDLVGQRNDGVVFTYPNQVGSWGPARQILTGTQTFLLMA